MAFFNKNSFEILNGDDLLALFDAMAEHPNLFFLPVTIASAINYFNGLSIGLNFAGIAWTNEEYISVMKVRGGGPPDKNVVEGDFNRIDKPDAEQVQELIAMQRSVYVKVLARMAQM